MSVLVVGSVALDTIKTPLGQCRRVLGGSATYSSVSASFFSPVNLVAVVGADFPKVHINLLQKKGINLEGLEIKKNGKTFSWEGEYSWDFSDPKTIATHLNVFSQFDPKIPKEYKNSEFLFLANIDPQIQAEVLKQINEPKLVVCDTMNYWIESSRSQLVKLLKDIDVFLLNESEARQLSGETVIVKAARAIAKMGPKKIIIKKGEHGSILFSNKSVFSVPAYLLESIFDPTGAGDTFAGGFIGYLAKNKKVNENTIRRAIVYGSIMATFAVEDFSLGRLGNITPDDIKARYEKFKALTCF
ncbi:MAG: bifunctional hydroxymethylpyrimidine kinase/phosphomethylpyrimidine kinase [Candidatus Omnitrophota bacterium]|nr:MAG: bifunctional hydroxymethylpyrimidine kinase/phosphomethylpyrimidine kinase [Candidatus Omnitrophota bacterium]